MAGGAVAVVAVVVALIGVKLGSGSASGAPRQPAPAAAISRLTTIPLSTLTAAAAKVSNLTAAQSLSDPPLTAGGKPEMLYIGAEFCPICATERWPMLVALSHFGTFANVSQTHSAVSDGDIPTLSFYGSTYRSPYLTFTPVETTTNQPSGSYYKTLETPTPAETALWQAKRAPTADVPVHRHRRQMAAPERPVPSQPWRATASTTSPTPSAPTTTPSASTSTRRPRC